MHALNRRPSSAFPALHTHPGASQCRFLRARTCFNRRTHTQLLAVSAEKQLHAALQTPTAPSQSPFYNQWLHERGVVTADGLALEGRTVKASKDLPPKTLLAWVPRSAQLHIDGIQDPRLQQLSQSLPHPPGSDATLAAQQALALLWHVARGTDSPLLPHIVRLPGIAGDAPYPPCTAPVFPDDVLDELQEPGTASAVRELKARNDIFVEQVLAPLPGSPDDPFLGLQINHALFGWAVTTMLSRTFDVFGVPALIDFVDHCMEPNVMAGSFSDCVTEPGQMHLGTIKAVSKGDTLCMEYGQMSNQSLLLSYGFILPDNPSGRFALPLDKKAIPPDTELSPEQAQALLTVEAIATSKDNTQSTSLADTPGQKQLVFLDEFENPVQTRRLKLVGKQLKQDTKFRAMLDAQYTPDQPGGVASMCDWQSALGREEEEKVQLALLQAMETHLQSFPTSIQEDEQALATAQSEASTTQNQGSSAETNAKQASTLAEAEEQLKEAVARIASGLNHPSRSEALSLAVAHRLEVKRALQGSADCVRERLQELQAPPPPAPVKGFGAKSSGASKAGRPQKRK